jgi:phosphatidylinositol alpha 1,6-mannosyltransferase
MPPPRVALFTGNYNYVIDGVALTMNRLVEYLERVGVAVRVYAPVAAKPALAHSGTLVPVPSVPVVPPYRLALGVTPSVKRDLHTFAPNIVHLATPDLLGFSALRWARRRKVAAVTTYHTHFVSYLKYYRVGFLEGLAWRAHNWFYPRCAQTYVAAASMADELHAHGVRANFVEAPFGVDPKQFHTGRRSMEWRRSLGIGDDEVVVGFVGRLVWEKGLAVFADVVNTLKAGGVKFRALVVGDGPAAAGLRTKLPDAVYTGRLAHDAVATAFASADVFFYPSASETFGCVTVEALASGPAVVVADATGSRDIVRNGVDGVVCAAGDVAGFAAAVRRLIEDRQERERLRAAGLVRAKEYEWDAVHARMVGNYRDVLGARKAASG